MSTFGTFVLLYNSVSCNLFVFFSMRCCRVPPLLGLCKQACCAQVCISENGTNTKHNNVLRLFIGLVVQSWAKYIRYSSAFSSYCFCIISKL